MAKILVGRQGSINLRKNGSNQLVDLGTELVSELTENGLALHFVRPDVERVYIEVTMVCNLDCAMCIRQEWRDPRGSMSAETFQSVFEGLKAFPNLKWVVFSGYGEPLTHPYLVEMVAQIHSLGVGITLITNGLLLEHPLAEALLQAGVDMLYISLDSNHLQAYQRAGFVKGQDLVLDNLEGVAGLIRDSGFRLPVLGIEYVATRNNQVDLQQLPDIAKRVGASVLIVNNLLPHTPDLANEILYDRSEPLQIGGTWGIQRAGWISLGTSSLPRMKWGADRRCRFINDRSLTIGWDGSVSPCLALMHTYPYYIYGRRKEVSRFVLGNANEQSLVETWTSEEYIKFRAKVLDFRFPSCVDCGMNCSFAEENTDCWGNEPSCADCLWAQQIIQCP